MKIREFFQKKAVKDFSAISGSDLALKPIGFLKSFLVAKYLQVADYGLLSGVNLVNDLAKYGNLGFRIVATREVLELKGAGSPETQINFIKDNSYTYEFILSSVLFAAGIASAFFYIDNILVFYCVILASFGLLSQKIRGIVQNEANIDKNFILIAKVTFVSGLFTAVFVSAFVPFVKIYAALIIPIFASILSIYMYAKSGKHKYRIVFNKDEFIRQVKIGFPITLSTLTLGSYVYLEKLAVISLLGLFANGLFGFAQMVLSQIVSLFLMPIRVRGVVLYENLGAGNYSLVNKIVIRETLVLLIMSIICIFCIWFAMDLFIPILLPKYTDAVPLTKMFLFVLSFKIIGSYTSVVLVSKTVNKQKIVPVVQLGSTVLLIFGIYILKHLNSFTLYSFVTLDLAGYAFYHLVILYLYYRLFYVNYVKVKSAQI